MFPKLPMTALKLLKLSRSVQNDKKVKTKLCVRTMLKKNSGEIADFSKIIKVCSVALNLNGIQSNAILKQKCTIKMSIAFKRRFLVVSVWAKSEFLDYLQNVL